VFGGNSDDDKDGDMQLKTLVDQHCLDFIAIGV